MSSDTDELEQRAANLRARSEHRKEKATRRRQASEWAERETSGIQGSATSDDGHVRVTVDNAGMLIQLELAPSTRGVRPVELAHVITSVARRAAAHARNQVREVYTGLLNEDMINELPANVLTAPAIERESINLTAMPEAGVATRASNPSAALNTRDAAPESPGNGTIRVSRRRHLILAEHLRFAEAEPEEPWEAWDDPGEPETWMDRRAW